MTLSSVFNKKNWKSKNLSQQLLYVSTSETDITIVSLVFMISNFCINKTVQGRKSVLEKNYLLV